MIELPNSQTVSTKLQRIAKLANEDPSRVLKSLAHHIDLNFLKEAHRLLRKDAAPGIDGQTAQDYAKNLDSNLEDLLNRFKSGSYHAPAVRRVYIAKSETEKRPLGIPTFEDKILQKAVTMVLTPVFEANFLDSSYAFRPGRAQQHALRAIWKGTMDLKGAWIVDADIKGYFDNIDHGKLREVLDQRVCDGVIRKQIDKWLKAGILEDGVRYCPDTGTPQGGVISPLLANVYLHSALDKWFENYAKPRMIGRCEQVRYADDFLLLFENELDAKAIFEVLPKRFEKFGLTLHPVKTKMHRFLQPLKYSKGRGVDRGGGKPGNFDFLGFTHTWGKSRKGNWIVKRKTAKDRVRRALKLLRAYCKKNRHLKLSEQHKGLTRKIRGHCQYYGIQGNSKQIGIYANQLKRIWKYWLGRRSQRAYVRWDKFEAYLLKNPLPKALINRKSIA